MIGLELDRLLSGSDRLFEPAAQSQHLAKIAVVESYVSSGSDRLLQQLDSTPSVARLVCDDPEEMQRRSVLRERL